MSCPNDGAWRAYLDQEVDAAAREQMVRHLDACAPCRQHVTRMQEVKRTAERGFQALKPGQGPHVEAALARWQNKIRDESSARSTVGRLIMDMRSWRRVWRPVVIVVAIMALLVGTFSFAPSRALARQLLSVFRVRKFAVVQISADPARLEEVERALENNLFLGEPEVISDEPVQVMNSLEEASERVGFQARLPQEGFDAAIAHIEVKGRSEATFPVTRENVTVLLQLAEMDEGALPADWEGGDVRISIPAAVAVRQGRYSLLQVLDPTVEYPDGIEPGLIGEAGLRVLGLTPAEAKRISEKLDWTSTIVLPVPTALSDFREVTVAGEQAILLGPWRREGKTGGETTLLWQKDGIVYVLSGPRSYETIIRMAESMF